MSLSVEDNYYGMSSSVSEIEEENSSHLHLNNDGPNPMVTIGEEENEDDDDTVYVAVGKSQSSTEALAWTLNNLATPSTMLFIIHVFPEIKLLPNPCNFSSYFPMPLLFIYFVVLEF